MNRILRDFYTNIAWTKLARVWVAFTGDWLKTIQFDHWVKQVHGFMWKVDKECANQRLFTKIENPNDCHCSCEWTYNIIMEETRTTPMEWQYYFNRENDKLVLKANIPNWVTEWRVVYSMWPEELTSIDDKICIDDNALVLLQYLVKTVYAEDNNEINMAQYYNNKFNELFKKERDNQERLPYRIIWLHQNI